MNKKDLKYGDRLTLRNGFVGVWFEETLLQTSTEEIYHTEYNGYLTHQSNDGFDIVKVERIQLDYNLYDLAETYGNKSFEENINNNLTYQTIWERDLTKMRKNEENCADLSKEQPKNIEPLKLQEATALELLVDKINEIVEVINNGRNNE